MRTRVDYLNYGNMLFMKGEPAGALQTYDAGLRTAPKAFQLRTGRGAALLMLDKKPDAISAFDDALTVASDEASKQAMYLMLATLHHEDGELKKARRYYKKLSAESTEESLAKACQVLQMNRQVQDPRGDASVAFIMKLLVRSVLGLAAFNIHRGDVQATRVILTKLIECGLPREDLAQFSLDKLSAKHGIKF